MDIVWNHRLWMSMGEVSVEICPGDPVDATPRLVGCGYALAAIRRRSMMAQVASMATSNLSFTMNSS